MTVRTVAVLPIGASAFAGIKPAERIMIIRRKPMMNHGTSWCSAGRRPWAGLLP